MTVREDCSNTKEDEASPRGRKTLSGHDAGEGRNGFLRRSKRVAEWGSAAAWWISMLAGLKAMSRGRALSLADRVTSLCYVIGNGPMMIFRYITCYKTRGWD